MGCRRAFTFPGLVGKLECGFRREHNRFMAAGEIPPSIPGSLMAEVERVAREQEKTVSQVVTEAVDRYVRGDRWERLAAYGSERARSFGLTEADVPRLIKEARREYGHER